MKYILFDKIDKRNRTLGIGGKNPVFETKEEWEKFNLHPTQEEIREKALELFEQESEETKYNYGDDAVLKICLRQAEHNLNRQYDDAHFEMIEAAEPLEGSCVFLAQERRVTMHDTAKFSRGIFVNIDVVNACMEEIKNQFKTGYPLIISDENGDELDRQDEDENEENGLV